MCYRDLICPSSSLRRQITYTTEDKPVMTQGELNMNCSPSQPQGC